MTTACLRNRIGLIICILSGCLIFLSGSLVAESKINVAAKANSPKIPPYEIFEIDFTHENSYKDCFFDVDIEMNLKSPSGKGFKVGGFFYGSKEMPKIEKPEEQKQKPKYTYDKHNLWKARFAPDEIGTWTYSWTFTDVNGGTASGTGSFDCIKARYSNHGFLRINPDNHLRFIFDDGTPFWPVGWQDGGGDNKGTGSMLSAKGLEGPFRTTPNVPPLGGMYIAGPSSNPLNADVQFRFFTRSGFNFYRYSQDNAGGPLLFSDLDHYNIHEARMTDELLQFCRKYQLRVMYGFFGFARELSTDPDDAALVQKTKRFLKYSVDRWGAYVDIWELLNEKKVPNVKWYEIMSAQVRSVDPYKHPITTSWEAPRAPGIEINAPHWYQAEENNKSDEVTVYKAGEYKKAGKPVVVGEQGNKTRLANGRPVPGTSGVWDIDSAMRMRIRLWTAMFNEICFIFWNTSYAKDGHKMNIWLGPKERQYVTALQCFSYCLDKDVKMAKVELSDPSVNAYALISINHAGVYLHHKDHGKEIKDLKVSIDVPKDGKAYWYSPEDASIISSSEAKAGKQTFAAPPFKIDLALLITADGCPDIDHDGKNNDVDDDNDNDGVLNSKDAYPLDPEETVDKDGDYIGDLIDADDNGDGIGDDDNHNGIPDCEEMDFDGDKVPKAWAISSDAFPWNPKEWRDTDGDGIGDNADPDDDNDGFTDEEEIKAGTDPLDRLSFPSEKISGK